MKEAAQISVGSLLIKMADFRDQFQNMLHELVTGKDQNAQILTSAVHDEILNDLRRIEEHGCNRANKRDQFRKNTYSIWTNRFDLDQSRS